MGCLPSQVPGLARSTSLMLQCAPYIDHSSGIDPAPDNACLDCLRLLHTEAHQKDTIKWPIGTCNGEYSMGRSGFIAPGGWYSAERCLASQVEVLSALGSQLAIPGKGIH
jgi:hypothetical protein